MPADEIPGSGPDLEPFLRGYLARDPAASEALFQFLASPLRRLARRYLRDFPEDIQAEIVGETFALLLQFGGRGFKPTRGSAWNYIYGIALNAVKNIRAHNGHKRLKTRVDVSHPGSLLAPPSRQELSLEELEKEPAVTSPEKQCDERIMVNQVLTKAPARVRFALEKIYFDEESRTTVAAELKIDRFTLHRELSAFSQYISGWRSCA